MTKIDNWAGQLENLLVLSDKASKLEIPEGFESSIQSDIELLVVLIRENFGDLTEEGYDFPDSGAIIGYIQAIEATVQSYEDIFWVLNQIEDLDSKEHILKLLQAGIPEIDKLTTFATRVNKMKGFVVMGMDPITSLIEGHDVNKHLLDVFQAFSMALYFSSKKGIAAAMDKLRPNPVAKNVSIQRLIENIHTYINYLYLMVATGNNVDIKAEDFSRFAPPTYFEHPIVETEGDIINPRVEFVAAVRTCLLNATEAIQGVGNNGIPIEKGLETIPPTEEHLTIKTNFTPSLDYEAGINLLKIKTDSEDEESEENTPLLYGRSITANASEFQSDAQFILSTISNRATLEGVDALVNAAEGYFEEPVGNDSNNGLRLAMSLVAVSENQIGYVRKIAGVAVNIVESHPGEPMPYTVHVMVLGAHADSIVDLTLGEFWTRVHNDYKADKDNNPKYIMYEGIRVDAKFDSLEALEAHYKEE